MAFSDCQQLNKLIGESKNILIIINSQEDADAICASLALKLFLEKQKKQVEVMAKNFIAPKKLQFLPNIGEIKNELSQLQKLIIKIDVSQTKIESLSYDIKDNWLSVFITPKQGMLGKDEVRLAQSRFKYDLILTVNVKDLQSLEDLYNNNVDLFFNTNIINFDHHTDNEYYGQLNMVDIASTSTSEAVCKILLKMGEANFDSNVSTCLLTGMIAKTHSFKTANINPYTLNLASKLMDMGADREKIVQNLYRNRPLSTLKLWGMILSNLQSDSAIGLVWSFVTRENFIKSGATEEDLQDIATELIGNSPEAKIILLLHEQIQPTEKIIGWLTVEKNFNAQTLIKTFNPSGNKKQARFVLSGKNLKEAEEEVIKSIKANLKASY